MTDKPPPVTIPNELRKGRSGSPGEAKGDLGQPSRKGQSPGPADKPQG